MDPGKLKRIFRSRPAVLALAGLVAILAGYLVASRVFAPSPLPPMAPLPRPTVQTRPQVPARPAAQPAQPAQPARPSQAAQPAAPQAQAPSQAPAAQPAAPPAPALGRPDPFAPVSVAVGPPGTPAVPGGRPSAVTPGAGPRLPVPPLPPFPLPPLPPGQQPPATGVSSAAPPPPPGPPAGPTAGAPPAQTGPGPTAGWTVAGIIDGERPFAIVRAGQAMHVVSEGDLIGTVRVVRIDAETRKVVFAFNSSTAEVRLGGDQSP